MLALVKLILYFFFGESNLPLIPKVRPWPNIKKLFLRLSASDDGLLPAPKIVTFSALPLSKLHQSVLLNVIP